MGKKLIYSIILILFASLPLSSVVSAKEDEFAVPNHVFNIKEENTESNVQEDYKAVKPSALTEELLKDAKAAIDNSDLIQLLNETTLKPSPVAVGYRGMIYLGRWPLHYESQKTAVNWEYQPINENELDNSYGEGSQEIHYIQEETKEVKGTLLNKVTSPDVVRKMLLEKARDKTNLPLSYSAVIGRNTQGDKAYHIPEEKHGNLQTYVPAVNEKGQMAFGDVYLELKGSKKQLVIKNITKQEIAAWLPVQNHVSFSFKLE